MIYDIYTSATGDQRRFSDNCSTCILSLLQDCGKLYFQDIIESAMTNESTREVKVSREEKQVVRKARVKIIRKPRD